MDAACAVLVPAAARRHERSSRGAGFRRHRGRSDQGWRPVRRSWARTVACALRFRDRSRQHAVLSARGTRESRRSGQSIRVARRLAMGRSGRARLEPASATGRVSCSRPTYVIQRITYMRLRNSIADICIYLRPLAVFAVAVLVALSVARVGLVLWQYDRVRAAGMLGTVFFQGVRFDLIVIGFLTVIPTLLLWLFATSRTMARVGNSLLRGYLVTAFAAMLFLELATPSFINQYDARPNSIFFEYLIYPKEVASTMLAGYSLQFLGAFAVITLALASLRRVLWPSLRIPQRALHVAAVVLVTPALVALCVLAMRSTLDHRAVNPSMVALSRDPMVNDLAMNSTYSVLYALAELRHEPEGGFRYGTMPADEATARVQDAMQVPAETFVTGTVPTLH